MFTCGNIFRGYSRAGCGTAALHRGNPPLSAGYKAREPDCGAHLSGPASLDRLTPHLLVVAQVLRGNGREGRSDEHQACQQNNSSLHTFPLVSDPLAMPHYERARSGGCHPPTGNRPRRYTLFNLALHLLGRGKGRILPPQIPLHARPGNNPCCPGHVNQVENTMPFRDRKEPARAPRRRPARPFASSVCSQWRMTSYILDDPCHGPPAN